FFFSSRRRHTRSKRDWSSDVCSSDLDFDENVSYFLSHLKMKGRSVYTILYYKRELRKFMVTLEEGGVATRLRRLTSDIIMDEYVMYVSEEKGARHASIAATLRAVKAFLNWAKIGRAHV